MNENFSTNDFALKEGEYPTPKEKGRIHVLSAEDQLLATQAGQNRFLRRRQTNSVHNWQRKASDHNTRKEIEAIGAEIACARVLGLPWEDTPTPDKGGDIGPGIQVRHTVRPNGRLFIHDDESDTHKFYLVTGNFPAYNVRGWVFGHDGKKDQWWDAPDKSRPPCFCVPQFYLQDIPEPAA